VKKIILSLVFSICIAFQALAFGVGDKVGVRFICEKADAALYLAQTNEREGVEKAGEAVKEMLDDGRCMVLPSPVPVEITKVIKQFKEDQVVEIKPLGSPEHDHLRFYVIGPKTSKGDI
jgi:hypothetical protein